MSALRANGVHYKAPGIRFALYYLPTTYYIFKYYYTDRYFMRGNKLEDFFSQQPAFIIYIQYVQVRGFIFEKTHFPVLRSKNYG